MIPHTPPSRREGRVPTSRGNDEFGEGERQGVTASEQATCAHRVVVASHARAAIPLLFVLATALALTGCGYHLRGEIKPPAGIRSVAVPVFTNKTYEPGLELAFTDRLRAEFLKGKGADLVIDRAKADAVLAGEVLSFRAVPTVVVLPKQDFAGTELGKRLLPTRYRAIVEVRVTLVSVSTGETLWEDRLEGTEEYDAGQAPEGFEPLAREAQQRTAIAAIAEDLMREAYDRMMSDF